MMQTPPSKHSHESQQALEDKLKVHVQREFTLGEKVIALLKQKKQLEKDLLAQQDSQKHVEQELQQVLESKESFQQKFLQAQEELNSQQHRLQRRSRMIIESEEDSRGNLALLRREIEVLQSQLNAVDNHKVEEQNALLRKIQALSQRERQQNQTLRKLSQQRNTTKKQLRTVMARYHSLSRKYQQEKKQHDEQLESLFREQVTLENQIESVRQEQQTNEESLQHEIAHLKFSKFQLEEKLQRMEQEKTRGDQDLDADLLQVIEKQEQFIEELKARAHQRSTLLRSENQALRQELENTSSEQEKVKWENQMLESSLKGLQNDLAEYMQLRKKFEDAQKEIEHFETIFHRRLRYLEPQDPREDVPLETAVQQEGDSIRIRQGKGHQQDRAGAGPEGKQSEDESLTWKDKLFSWLNFSNQKLFTAFLVLLIVGLAIGIYSLVPWQYILLERSSLSRTTPEQALQPAPAAEILEEKQQEAPQMPGPARASSESKRKAQPPEISADVKPQPTSSANIVVQVPTDHARRFLPQQPTPFPTLANNSILRRYAERTTLVSRQ